MYDKDTDDQLLDIMMYADLCSEWEQCEKYVSDILRQFQEENR